MELLLESVIPSAMEMKNAHDTMLGCFKDLIRLEKYFGPVQMDVWRLEYRYSTKPYTICVECERGFITISVINDKDEKFYPHYIYDEADYFHFADKRNDVLQLVNLTYRAITKNEIVFLSAEEIRKRGERKLKEMTRKK